MAKEKKKPDFDNLNMGINPFIQGLFIAVTKKSTEVFNRDGKSRIMEQDLESTPYTKVFMVEAAKYQMVELPIRSKELYLWLIHAVKAATDYIWIDKEDYMRQMGIKSVNTFKGAVDGLCQNLYIQPHYRIKDTYWINPHYFFKGSRINKYPDSIVRK